MANVLFINDYAPYHELIQYYTANKPYTLNHAYGGEEGFEKIEALNPDLVILDFKMPDKNGAEVLAEMHNVGNNTPVIFMSSFGGDILLQKIRKANAEPLATMSSLEQMHIVYTAAEVDDRLIAKIDEIIAGLEI